MRSESSDFFSFSWVWVLSGRVQQISHIYIYTGRQTRTGEGRRRWGSDFGTIWIIYKTSINVKPDLLLVSVQW